RAAGPVPARCRSLKARAASCGFAAAALAAIVAGIGARYEPGYDACAQFISELGATRATNGGLVAWAFAAIGVLVLAFLAFASRLLPPGRRTSVSLLCWSAVGAAYLG